MTPAPATAIATSDISVARNSLGPYTQQQPDWQRCDARSPAAFQCATLEVPLDYGDPGGRKVEIAISRLRASSAKERRGVLLLNPGGPGGPGLNMPVDVGADLPAKVKRQYDLIGFDPRGVGRSSPVGCGLTADERITDRPYRAGTFAKDVRWARTVAAKCRAKGGDTLRHLTTRNTARDMDVIRAVLGEKKISYLGYSYGTYLGAVYTQLFPRRADRFVLDSAADPARYGRGTFQGMAAGTELAFTRWSRWAARRHTTYALGSTPAEVRRTFWHLVARADRKPIDSDEGPLTGDGVRAQRATFFRVRAAASWVAGLKTAAEGREPVPSGTPGQAVPQQTGPQRAGPRQTGPQQTGSQQAVPQQAVPPDNADASSWAVLCADTSRTWPRDPGQYRRDAIRDKARYPLYGDFASTIKPCAFWKPGSEPPTKVHNKVRSLIVHNEWDPQTPLASGQAMHRALRGSRMITVAGGEGHGVYPFGSCADKSATRYLTTGRLPAKDLTCRKAG
ncbi:alpha/beta fold hydrolase [Streptomyces flavofungini]|uniref:Alpha/beta fold hydrolase n=1 Tax=Streptomyces flavofungini TaxID=68200 RepID=A0ABS0WXS4_9ACTN|nr:alpha/beta fold hydrolase [Streptomyces flavofungini]